MDDENGNTFTNFNEKVIYFFWSLYAKNQKLEICMDFFLGKIDRFISTMMLGNKETVK